MIIFFDKKYTIQRHSFHPMYDIRGNFKSVRIDEATRRVRAKGDKDGIFGVDTNDREAINNVTGQRGSCYVSGKRIVPITRTHVYAYGRIARKRASNDTLRHREIEENFFCALGRTLTILSYSPSSSRLFEAFLNGRLNSDINDETNTRNNI